ncbi:DUF2169 family type VI secretion system accessory protein [Paracoccus pacificus]|uniref:DUF2169 domain-containing protein n=1 Tax=Paracoccus pacificus TaxID=1463598 RepID=A0ABW4R613_9RHOB
MWDLTNDTPFAATAGFARDARGAEVRCSAVVAVFEPVDQHTCRQLEAGDPRLVPIFGGKDAAALLHDADLVPFRPNTDIIITGDAVAPGGRKAPWIDIGLDIGKLSRRLQARPAAVLRRGRWGWKVEPEETGIDRLAIGWDVALGGRDPFAPDQDDALCPDNPVGKGWSLNLSRARSGDSIAMPQLIRAGEDIQPDKPMPTPAGTGLVHPAWPVRGRHAGTFDAAWQRNVAPLLPADFDPAFHQAAPADQVYPGIMAGGERVTITGMHEEGAWSFRLPQVVMAQTCRIGGATDTARMRLISVQIDAAQRRVRMVWNAATPCTGRDHLLERTALLVVQMSGIRA